MNWEEKPVFMVLKDTCLGIQEKELELKLLGFPHCPPSRGHSSFPSKELGEAPGEEKPYKYGWIKFKPKYGTVIL